MSVVTENVSKPKSKRIFYFDALRALAICSVIVYHVFKRTQGIFDGSPELMYSFNWFINDILGNCFRCGVDIFLMLSGALSLGRVWDIKSFLGKRLPRIAMPFVFWGFVLSVLLLILSVFYPTIITAVHWDLMSFLGLLRKAFLAKISYFGPYWFFWLILGTYLIMPIFNKWLLHADLKEAEYFLVIWLVTCFFDYTIMKDFPVKLSYFSGPIGMVVLGYYLRHTKRKIFNNQYFALLLTILAPLILVGLSCLLSTGDSVFYMKSRYSILMALEVIGVFLLFKNFGKFNLNINFLKNPNGIFRRGVFSIAKYSYGLYLVHQCVMDLLIDFLPSIGYKPLITVLFFGTLGISWGLLALLNRVPHIKNWIGAK